MRKILLVGWMILLEEATRRGDRTFDLFSDGKIDDRTFQQQSSRIVSEIESLSAQRNELEPPDLDVPALLAFAETVTTQAANAWIQAGHDDRQCLQAAIFPEGVIYANGSIGTAKTSLFFGRLAAPEMKKTDLVTLTFASWNQIASVLRRIDGLRSAA